MESVELEEGVECGNFAEAHVLSLVARDAMPVPCDLQDGAEAVARVL